MKPKRKAKSKPKSEPKPPIAAEAESPTEFAFAIARTAVAQICQSVGFTSARLSAVHTLTAVAAAYLQAAAKSSAALAAAANRTDSNLLDLAAALHDLRSGAALSAASSDRCPLRSSALADVIAFAQSTPETPFAKPVPQRHCRPNSSPGERGLIWRPPHVPHWLPEAPERLAAAERRERGRGGGGEELWEDRVGVEMELDLEERERERERVGKLGFVLREERERVRFKVGLRREREREKEKEKGVCWDRQKIGFKKNGGCVGVVEGE